MSLIKLQMRYITSLYIPDLPHPKDHSKLATDQQLTAKLRIALNRFFLHLRVEREFLLGLFLHPLLLKPTLSQQLTKFCKPYLTNSTCALMKNGTLPPTWKAGDIRLSL